MAAHIQEHQTQFKSWKEVSHKKVIRYKVLRYQYMFKYKIDKHSNLQKCKTKLLVFENQQQNHDLPIKATTLTIISFHILLAIATKLDLETL